MGVLDWTWSPILNEVWLLNRHAILFRWLWRALVAAKTCVRRSSFLDSRKRSLNCFLRFWAIKCIFWCSITARKRAVEVIYILSEKRWIVKTAVPEKQHIILENMFFETRNTIEYDHWSIIGALLIMAFARGLYREKLEPIQDMALSCKVLNRSFRNMSPGCICFWVSAVMKLIASAFSILDCGMRLKEQGSRKLAELNTREPDHCQDSSGRWSWIIA